MFKTLIKDRFLVTIVSVLFCTALHSQPSNDTKLLEELIGSLNEGVNTRDYAKVLDVFAHPSALIYSVHNGVFAGTYASESNTAQGLADFIQTTDKEVRQNFENIRVSIVSPGRAVVTTHYSVLLDGENSHQGDEYYSAIKTKSGWKFISLMFTLETF
ncbi:MAG: hypothetical protein ABJG78_18780 [Cyclobacteriaceae bacterium]